MIQIYAACDGNWSEPEVKVSGSAKFLSNNLGDLLNEVTNSISTSLSTSKDKFYPISIPTLVIELEYSGNEHLTVIVDKNQFILKGTNFAFNKLGDSLINYFYFGANVGEHFHLDYYEGNQILNYTNCHLIFVCDR